MTLSGYELSGKYVTKVLDLIALTIYPLNDGYVRGISKNKTLKIHPLFPFLYIFYQMECQSERQR